MGLELPSGIRVLNPVPLDERLKRPDLLNDDTNEVLFFVGLGPIYDETTGKHYTVTGGSAGSGWTFSEVGGGGGAMSEDVTVKGVTVGTFEDGDTITNGTSISDVIKAMLVNRIPPDYRTPTSGLSASMSTVEVGTTLNPTLTPTFSQRDAGALSQVQFFRGGNLIQTQGNADPYQDTDGYVIGEETVQYRADFDYAQGPVLNDNLGDPDPTGQIPAGTRSSTDNVVGEYKTFYGPVSVVPTTSAEVRALSSTYNNSFTLNTGDTEKNFVIAVQEGKTLDSVIDIDSLNVNLTGNYTTVALDTVNDAAGVGVTYNVHVLTVATPYSSNKRHNVTLS